jgi:hypothetical protein
MTSCAYFINTLTSSECTPFCTYLPFPPSVSLPLTVLVPNPAPGTWTITYFGIGSGPFTITVAGSSETYLSFSGVAVPGAEGSTHGIFTSDPDGTVTSLTVTNEIPGGALTAMAAAFGGLVLLSAFMSRRGKR